MPPSADPTCPTPCAFPRSLASVSCITRDACALVTPAFPFPSILQTTEFSLHSLWRLNSVVWSGETKPVPPPRPLSPSSRLPPAPLSPAPADTRHPPHEQPPVRAVASCTHRDQELGLLPARNGGAHGHGLRRRRGLVQQRGVGDGHARHVAHQRLEVEQRLQAAGAAGVLRGHGAGQQKRDAVRWYVSGSNARHVANLRLEVEQTTPGCARGWGLFRVQQVCCEWAG